MTQDIAGERAKMPEGTNKVLDKRTLENANKNLLKYLQPGMHVLDVGCGSGSITKGIAEKVGPSGKVTGIDTGEQLVALANTNYPELDCRVADIYNFDTTERYDVITSARVLQWLKDPQVALLKMKTLLKPNGVIAILDYNHEKISWTPAIPAEMQLFYNAFLQWRKDAGFDNAIADHLGDIFSSIGFDSVHTEEQHEISTKNEPDFERDAAIWSEVAKTRGQQLVKDGYIKEEERLSAIAAYDKWIKEEGQQMQLYLLAIEAGG